MCTMINENGGYSTWRACLGTLENSGLVGFVFCILFCFCVCLFVSCEIRHLACIVCGTEGGREGCVCSFPVKLGIWRASSVARNAITPPCDPLYHTHSIFIFTHYALLLCLCPRANFHTFSQLFIQLSVIPGRSNAYAYLQLHMYVWCM